MREKNAAKRSVPSYTMTEVASSHSHIPSASASMGWKGTENVSEGDELSVTDTEITRRPYRWEKQNRVYVLRVQGYKDEDIEHEIVGGLIHKPRHLKLSICKDIPFLIPFPENPTKYLHWFMRRKANNGTEFVVPCNNLLDPVEETDEFASDPSMSAPGFPFQTDDDGPSEPVGPGATYPDSYKAWKILESTLENDLNTSFHFRLLQEEEKNQEPLESTTHAHSADSSKFDAKPSAPEPLTIPTNRAEDEGGSRSVEDTPTLEGRDSREVARRPVDHVFGKCLKLVQLSSEKTEDGGRVFDRHALTELVLIECVKEVVALAREETRTVVRLLEIASGKTCSDLVKDVWFV